MNPFLVISAELEADEKKASPQASTPAKPVVAANDDRYSKVYYGEKAANE